MKCPGQDMQFWESDAIFDIDCPECGKPVEFYKDDTTRKCSHCGHRFVNPKMDFGCAAYCKFAEQCLGTLPEEFIGSRDNLLKDKVAVETKRFYKTDFKKIGRVTRIARYAERIGKEEGANMPTLLCLAYLNDIGRKSAGQKYQTPGPFQIRQESKAIALDILNLSGAKETLAEEVIHLISILGTPEAATSAECGVISDALRIVALEDTNKTAELTESEVADVSWLTAAGAQVAAELFGRG